MEINISILVCALKKELLLHFLFSLSTEMMVWLAHLVGILDRKDKDVKEICSVPKKGFITIT